ncbi:MAG TPA: GNAT family N-acetyltransferase [Steroidobacteraceae bacterium]
MPATITDNQAMNRFELQLDGGVAFIDYRRAADHVTLLHAEVPPQLSGRGVGTEMARATLDALRNEGARVRIRCSFVAAFAARHPEYKGILID